MITVYPYENLGNNDHGWLNAHFHFSFADYRDENRMGFGPLRVINDDVIQPQTGFDTHPHQNMEIITYVRRGAITHRDSTGNTGRTVAGDVQVMSAGSGIYHSEYNLEDTETNLYQIWIHPDRLGVTPRWDTKRFPKDFVTDALPLLVSGGAHNDDALFIHQKAYIYGGKVRSGTIIDHALHHQAYVLVSEGEITLDDHPMKKGDGAEITGQQMTRITALTDAEVLVIDVPATRRRHSM